MSITTSPPADKPHYDISFPPFPPVPAGVIIVPFKDWEEGGICEEPGPLDAEVDTLGIPTVVLNSKGHSDNVCKTNTKRKKLDQEVKARKKQGKSRTWWQEWEDRESARAAKSVNPFTSEYERLHAAAQDFTSDRVWPTHFKSQSGPRFVWTRLQAYLGIPEINKSKRSKGDDQEMSDDEDEEDEEADPDGTTETTNPQGANILTQSELRSRAAAIKAASENEARLDAFFKDPEAALRIFMSSYAHDLGFLSVPVNLEAIPRLVGFFVNFLLRNAVFPELDRQLRGCLSIVEKALTELHSDWTILRALDSDKFCRAGRGFGGDMQGAPYQANIADNEEGEHGTLDESLPLNESPPLLDDSLPQDESPAPESDPEYSDDDGAEADSWASGVATGWNDSGTGGWDSSDVIDVDKEWGVISDEVEEEPKKPDLSGWFDPPDYFFQFLGPTTLPLTHKTGIVMQAMLKVKAVVPPNNNTPKPAVQADGVYEPSADAIEADLDRLFTKIVLSPMIDWDYETNEEYRRPKILEASRGPVVGDAAGTGANDEQTASVTPFDPLADEVTLIVDSPEAISHFTVGMGIGGVWVQLVRDGPPPPKKKKSKSKKSFNGYWYLEHFAMVTPTFWLASKDV